MIKAFGLSIDFVREDYTHLFRDYSPRTTKHVIEINKPIQNFPGGINIYFKASYKGLLSTKRNNVV